TEARDREGRVDRRHLGMRQAPPGRVAEGGELLGSRSQGVGGESGRGHLSIPEVAQRVVGQRRRERQQREAQQQGPQKDRSAQRRARGLQPPRSIKEPEERRSEESQRRSQMMSQIEDEQQ